jgi:hypothetical protein
MFHFPSPANMIRLFGWGHKSPPVDANTGFVEGRRPSGLLVDALWVSHVAYVKKGDDL